MIFQVRNLFFGGRIKPGCPRIGLPVDYYIVVISRPFPTANGSFVTFRKEFSFERTGWEIMIAVDQFGFIALGDHGIVPDSLNHLLRSCAGGFYLVSGF